ncbi:hypothetical protein [Dokdonia sp.]|uniref:hypothetical protein n=1 Tax=Dokdonia sp. TaxID=2024995 RepID=UPI003265ABDA
MKNVFQITTVLFLLVQTIGYSQTESTTSTPTKQDTVLQKESSKTETDTKKFIGTYLLEEANFTLEILAENDKMYIVTSFSKDLLVIKNETTLREPTRGVDLELIKDDKNALKYTQNGYVTTIKRVKSN